MFSGLPTPIHVLPQDSEPVAVMLAPSPVSSLLPTPQADAPNPSLIPESDAVGVTVLLLTCTYRRQEFIRVGYYVNNEYPSLELRESPPAKPDFSQVGLPASTSGWGWERCLLQQPPTHRRRGRGSHCRWQPRSPQ